MSILTHIYVVESSIDPGFNLDITEIKLCLNIQHNQHLRDGGQVKLIYDIKFPLLQWPERCNVRLYTSLLGPKNHSSASTV